MAIDCGESRRPWRQFREYAAIAAEYGDRVARRSRVPLMHHIDEGLEILARLGATEATQRAFCLHPLLQDDAAFARNGPRLAELTDDPRVAALALEYRRVANATLSTRPIVTSADIPISALSEVNTMLVADKVQNRKDFLHHHLGRHPRGAELDRYFRLWLDRLGLDETQYETLVRGL
jgi:hypothetical protein